MTRTNSLNNEVISRKLAPMWLATGRDLAIETTYGEIATTDRLDPRRGTGLILVVGDCEVQSGASVREYEGLTNPPTNYRATLSGHWFDLGGGSQLP
jgi:hypothetical protein